jgi:hypothetical protein
MMRHPMRLRYRSTLRCGGRRLFGVPAMPILAAPLVVRRAQVEAGALAALLGRAFEAESWDAPGTERELFW